MRILNLEMKSEMKKLLNSNLEVGDKGVNKLEDRLIEMIRSVEQREKRQKKNKKILSDLQNNIKRSNICGIGASEGEQTEFFWGRKNIHKEIMMENINLGI